MEDIQIRKRHHLRKKDSKRIVNSLMEQLGIEIALIQDGTIELAERNEYQLIIVNNSLFGFILDDQPFLSIHGFLALGEQSKNAKKYVTVDMGAVKFVTNGADVMAPGIVDADPEIEKNDLVWIREETHLKPLAVGRALSSGSEILEKKGGKAVKTLHYVGDKLWGIRI